MFKSFIVMMRSLIYIVTGAFLVFFAVNNRAPITLDFSPLLPSVTMPVWVLFFAGLFFGLVISAAVTSMLRLEGFTKRRKAERRANDLDKKVSALTEDTHSLKAAHAHDTASGKAPLAREDHSG